MSLISYDIHSVYIISNFNGLEIHTTDRLNVIKNETILLKKMHGKFSLSVTFCVIERLKRL